MKIKYLGTAAAEGVPAIFCRCEVCRKSKAAGGRNIRTRSQSIIDDRLLLDFCPDTFIHTLRDNIDLISIKSCLITHAHEDHLYPQDIQMRLPECFANFMSEEVTPLSFYGSDTTLQWIRDMEWCDALTEKNVLALHPVKAFEPFEVEGYTVTALKADHDQKTDPFIYIISNGEKTMLYAHDTGYFPDETWDYLERQKPVFDFVSIDCTGMFENYRQGHMGLSADADTKDRMIKRSLRRIRPFSAATTSPTTAERPTTNLSPRRRRRAFSSPTIPWNMSFNRKD